jgi:hypothetical protein
MKTAHKSWTTYSMDSKRKKKVFTVQKKVIRIIAGVRKRVSCGELFKKLYFLFPVSSYSHFRSLWTWKSFKQIQTYEL